MLFRSLYYKKEIISYQPPSSYTSVLHEAVEADQPDMIQLLILHGFNPDVRAKGGLTPLHLAITKAKVSCVRALVENGADMSMRDKQGQDAIAKAERSKKRESILKLLRSKGMTLHGIRLLIPKSNYIIISLSRIGDVCGEGSYERARKEIEAADS